MTRKKEKRPSLTPAIGEDDFLNFYWLKQELVEFCRDQGLSTAGGKLDLKKRIQHFLRTGRRDSFNVPPMLGKATKLNAFSLSEPVPDNFQCTREARDFFISQVGPTFHYSVALQNYIKTSPGITFQEILNKWKELKSEKKKGAAKTTIGPQFEYNQFTRDFFRDPKNRAKSKADCIAAWKLIRTQRGDRKYRAS